MTDLGYFNMTVKVEDKSCELTTANSNNNNNNNNVNNHFRTTAAALAQAAAAAQAVADQQNTLTSLDSVVQRLIDKKMGRRKQNCPQRTGLASEEGKT